MVRCSAGSDGAWGRDQAAEDGIIREGLSEVGHFS